MANPYLSQPDRAFWGRAVARLPAEAVDPVSEPRFCIHASDQVASAGSCFAQHLGRAIAERGFNYLITEQGPVERQFGVYPARFGNLYTARQLLQLFQRAFGLFEPDDVAWRRGDAWIDPFRPQVEAGGFERLEALLDDRGSHLAAVRRMFESMDVLVFTLGLTEAWMAEADGAVFPLAPGVGGEPQERGGYRFHNFSVQEVVDDLALFISKARVLRPHLKLLLTVSPVPLVATITNQHVLAATTYSKSVLRVAAEQAAQSLPGVDYFPSYEVITGQHNRHAFLADDLRSVRPEGVAQVMSIFERHYLSASPGANARATGPVSVPHQARELAEVASVICDEEALAR